MSVSSDDVWHRAVDSFHRWLTATVDELEFRTSNPPEVPADWRRRSDVRCKCSDCQELSRFLEDPDTETLRLPLNKHCRQHLNQVIDRNELDLTHVTQRVGRPYTLVCTKTKASYERALEAHQLDLDHLRKMQAMLDWHEGPA